MLPSILDSLHDNGVFVYYSRPDFALNHDKLSAVIQPFTLDGQKTEKLLTFIRKSR